MRPIVHGRPYMAELHERVSALGEGDLLYFVDWRGDPDQRLTDDPALDGVGDLRRGGPARRRRARAALALALEQARLPLREVAPARHRDRRGRRAVPARHAGAHRRLAPPEVRRAAAPRRPVARHRLPRRHRPVPQPPRRHRPRGRPAGDRDAAGVRPAPGLARRARRDRGPGGLRRRDHLPRAVGGLHPADPQPGPAAVEPGAARAADPAPAGRAGAAAAVAGRGGDRGGADPAHLPGDPAQGLRLRARRASAAWRTPTPRPSPTPGGWSTSRTSTCGRRRSAGTSARPCARTPSCGSSR